MLRAVVGSLVLCAAMSAPSVKAQELSPRGAERTELINVRFDHRAFKDLLAKVSRLHADGLLDLDDTFDITVEADRNTAGTLQEITLANVTESNKRWRELIQDFAIVLSDSRLVSNTEDPRRLSMRFTLGGQSAAAAFSFEAESDARATQLANSYGPLFRAAQSRRTRPEEILIWNNLKVSANGKRLMFKLELTREQAGNLLRQHLALP